MSLKKLTSLCLAAAMAVTMAACGGDTATSTSGSGDSGQSQDASAGSDASGSDAAATDDSSGSDTAASTGILSANGDPANTTATDETITIGLASEPSTIWGAPEAKTENEAEIVCGAILDTLVHTDYSTGEIVPGLATEWEWKDDTHCKFTLRDDVIMSDGTPLVADDVVYTVGIWTEYSSSTDTGRFVKGAKAKDDKTVIIEYNVAAPDMLAMMSDTNFGIVSEDEVEAAGGIEKVGKNPVVGCGKYKFAGWKNGQNITLERNDDYWDKDWVGYYKTIVLTFTNDAAAREMAVESGDAQVAYDMPVSQASTFVGSDKVNVVVYSFGQTAHLWYNMGDKAGATKDAKVREAIDKALNFDALTQVQSGGFAEPALGYFTKDSKYYNETYTTEERAVDVEGAKQLLEEAGYGDGLDLTILGTAEAKPLYEVIQANLREVGINVEIDTPDTPSFVQSAFAGDFDLIMVGEYTAARFPTLFPFLVKANVDSGYVIGGPKWTTEEIDAQITAIIEEKDEAKAKEMIGDFENMMKEQFIVSNICPEMKATIMAKDLKGFTTRQRGFVDLTGFYK